jgi:uncharacterized metal-binding protein YceD (DUF177 family)
MPALSIPIHDLDNLGKDFVFVLEGAWLTEAFAETPSVRGDTDKLGEVRVHAQRNGREILVHGRAEARLITECGRCLGDVAIDVACDLAALYAPTATPGHRGGKRAEKPLIDADDDELDIDPNAPDREFYTGDHVVIDDLVRDYLLLELPMQPRCEPECALPLRAAAPKLRAVPSDDASGEGTIDPRLEPLKKLAKSERDKE